ncbi:hypothetical protein [Natronomonas salsuginis]|uniref:Uncharacterized protein n=1 Tax=Natronomonas salsuginis TaxID=2217661 RepID=A0A4V5ZP77_9EURY|nr:hypothetical protein [Natronomonas salsuginis]TKR27953.1 hypothetical protein DM868_02400 [Natronomonas salsuginis]
MTHPNSTNNKTTGSIDKSGTAVIDIPHGDALEVDVTYIDTTARKTIYYLTGRSDGIDFITTDREVVARSERAQTLLNEHTDSDTETSVDGRTDPQHAVMTDGGEE